jgi:hypothetical protein
MCLSLAFHSAAVLRCCLLKKGISSPPGKASQETRLRPAEAIAVIQDAVHIAEEALF